MSTVCLLLPLKCLIVKDRVRPRWVLVSISLHGSLLLPCLLLFNPFALPPTVGHVWVCAHSRCRHLGNFWEPLIRSSPELEALRAAAVRRSVGIWEWTQTLDKKMKRQAEWAWAALPGCGRGLMTRPNPSSCGYGHGCDKKTRECQRNEVPAIIQKMNAHECLRMLFLSFPSSLPDLSVRSLPETTPPKLHRKARPLNACVSETTPALP